MRFIPLLLLISFLTKAQDSLYTREVLKFLTSKKCYGRGYVNGGMKNAAGYIVKELQKSKALPLFDKTYLQAYVHPVNTFPKKVQVKLNGKDLIPGRDFIVDPACPNVKGHFDLTKNDSTHYVSTDPKKKFSLTLQKKLTWSVALDQSDVPHVDILRSQVKDDARTLDVNIQAQLDPAFVANNIGAFIEGENNDSMVVLTAHYDHLGMMGKNCMFPGANDNASGTSMVLNFVKYFAKNKPKYKTVFIFFSSEEAGLIGSRFFTEHPAVDLHKIKFLVNLDLLGTGDDGFMVVNGAIYTKQFEVLENINKEEHLVREIKKRGKAQNSDHYWFTEKGVPSFFIYTLGGVSFYHDINDVEKTLPLTDYKDVFKLLVEFVSKL
jgi:aminopeptidase YwaD